MSNWSDHLRRYRRLHALTQAALAEFLGVEQATISRWERGTHQPELGMQRRLRELMRGQVAQSDQLVFHRARCSLAAVKIANRSAQNFEASSGAAKLHGVDRGTLARCNYRPLFTELLETQWNKAIEMGFFAGELASVRVFNYWRPANGRPARYCLSYWTPVPLADGEILLHSDFVEIPEAEFQRTGAANQFSVTSMDELVQ